MSLDRLQAVISKIFSDETFRKRLLAKPTEVLAECGLNSEEKEAFCRMQGRMGLATDLGTLSIASQDWFERIP